MANKPILEVGVDDTAFQRFMDAFKTYTDKLEDLPEEWRRLGEVMGETGGDLEKSALGAHHSLALAATSTSLIVEALQKAAIAQKDFGQATHDSAKGMKSLAEQSKAVGEHVFGLGKFLMRLASFGGIGAALTGLGGGLGIFSLASAATNQSRTAGGLGLTPGQMNAFTTNLSPFLNAGNVLSGAANAQVDLTQYGSLAALGINPQQAQSENAAQLAVQEIEAVRRSWRANHNINSAQALAAEQLGFSPSDIRNVGSANAKELRSYENRALNDAGKFGWDQKTAESWRELDTALSQAGAQALATLVRGLAPLADPLAHLSAQLTGLVSDFITKDGKSVISAMSDGLAWLSRYLGSEQFQKDITSFEDGVGSLASKIVKGLQLLHLIPDGSAPAGSSSSAPALPTERWDSDARGLPGINSTILSPLLHPTGGKNAFDFSGVSKFYGLPASMWQTSGMIESGLNPATPDSVVKGVHYQGMWQMGPAMQAQYGVKDPMDPKQEANAYGRAMDDYLSLYRGDLAKAVAAYDWGAGNLDKDVAAHGADWQKFAPAETQSYIKRMIAGVGTDTIHPDLKAGAPPASPIGMGAESRSALKRALAPPGNSPNSGDRPGEHRSGITGQWQPLNGGSADLKNVENLLQKIHATLQTKPATVAVTNSSSARIAVQLNAAGR